MLLKGAQMTEVISYSLNTRSRWGERTVSSTVARAVKTDLVCVRVVTQKSSFRTLLEACRRLLSPRGPDSSNLNRKESGRSQEQHSENSYIAALTAALNSEKGARAKAVHLVVVEQTLLQEILGGLNAVPVGVLRHAISQLASLSRYQNYPELKLLLLSMKQIVDEESKVSERQVIVERCGQSDLVNKSRQFVPTVTKVWVEASRRLLLEPAESIAEDDDFPDTEAFASDEADIPLPMPQMGGGSTEKNFSNQKQV
jgi:hypothetical protein